jgi:hypothetical protein
LVVEDSVVQNMHSTGLNFSPNGTATFSVSNTRFTGNGGQSATVLPAASVVGNGSFEHVIFDGGGIGFESSDLSGPNSIVIEVTFRDCTITNSQLGMLTGGGSFTVQNSTVTGNGTGILAGARSTVRVRASLVTGNQTAFGVAGGGSVESYGDNSIDGNTTNNPPAVIALH